MKAIRVDEEVAAVVRERREAMDRPATNSDAIRSLLAGETVWMCKVCEGTFTLRPDRHADLCWPCQERLNPS